MVTILFLIAIAISVIAYVTYGKFLSNKVFNLDDNNKTPAHTMRDDVDYVLLQLLFSLDITFLQLQVPVLL